MILEHYFTLSIINILLQKNLMQLFTSSVITITQNKPQKHEKVYLNIQSYASEMDCSDTQQQTMAWITKILIHSTMARSTIRPHYSEQDLLYFTKIYFRKTTPDISTYIVPFFYTMITNLSEQEYSDVVTEQCQGYSRVTRFFCNVTTVRHRGKE